MLYHAIGTALLTNDEITQTDALRAVQALFISKEAAPVRRRVALLNGEIGFDDFALGSLWGEIGIGQPMCVTLHEVYTGKYPSSGIFGGAKDMLITTAIKSVVTYDAAPRAVNFLTKHVSQHSRFFRPRATEEGTPVVFYTPAAVEPSYTLDVSIVFDSFPEPAFDAVGNAFKSSGSVPIFMSASPYLIAAGEIAHLVGEVGEKLFDGKPSFDVTEALDIQWQGGPPLVPGFRLLTPIDLDTAAPDFRKKYSVKDGAVVDDAGQPYSGDIPYVVILIDGNNNDALKGFTPHAASAAVLSRFLDLKEGQSQPIDVVMDALKLFNDYSFRTQIDALDKQIASLPDDDKNKAILKTKREALLKNMVTDLLKPKS